jgi:hypothetical protein
MSVGSDIHDSPRWFGPVVRYRATFSVRQFFLFKMITHIELLTRFHYCPTTGQFFRITAKGRRPAGTRNSCGYIRIVIDRKAYLAHRLAWLYVHGRFPAADTDHINGDRADNRISNLRDVPRSVNAANRHTANKNNASHVLGVSARRNRWVAQRSIQGTNRYLGMFDTAEAAQHAYAAATQTQGEQTCK